MTLSMFKVSDSDPRYQLREHSNRLTYPMAYIRRESLVLRMSFRTFTISFDPVQ
jgi:hypothetical protein